MYLDDKIHLLKRTRTNISSYIVGLLFKNYILDILFLSFAWSFIIKFVRKEIGFYDPSITSFIFCFIVLDFVLYWVHRVHHKVPFLWANHFVHHSDMSFNSSTFLRSSWIKKFYYWIFFATPLFLGFPLEIILGCLYLTYVYQVLVHSQYLKFPYIFEKILVTPRSHSVHHTTSINNQNGNFGEVLGVWDHIFGTYIGKNEKSLVYGIDGYKEEGLLRVQVDPLLAYLKSFFRLHLKNKNNIPKA